MADSNKNLIKISLLLLLLAIAQYGNGKKIKDSESSQIYNGQYAGEVEFSPESGKPIIKNTGQYPYVVQLFNRAQPICGGAIIRDNIVLTAAHCTQDMIASNLVVLGGTLNIAKNPDSTTQLKRVKDFIQHPAWNLGSLDSDISILILSERFDFAADNVGPIKLADHNKKIVGDKVRILGWGFTEHGDYSDDLLYVDTRVISNQACQKLKARGGGSRVSITDRMMCCLGDTLEEGHGKGDSGGPLVKIENGKDHTLVGLVSWSDKKLVNNNFVTRTELGTVYADISGLRPWIDSKLKAINA